MLQFQGIPAVSAMLQHHTPPAALTIQDLMDSLREWLELLRS